MRRIFVVMIIAIDDDSHPMKILAFQVLTPHQMMTMMMKRIECPS